jgi:hypothetical protein
MEIVEIQNILEVDLVSNLLNQDYQDQREEKK